MPNLQIPLSARLTRPALRDQVSAATKGAACIKNARSRGTRAPLGGGDEVYRAGGETQVCQDVLRSAYHCNVWSVGARLFAAEAVFECDGAAAIHESQDIPDQYF